MGSLENGVLLKKDQQQNNHYNNNNNNNNNSNINNININIVDTNNNSSNIGRVASFSKQQRNRSRFPKLFPKRLGYLQWISTIVVFSLLLVVFQVFLPSSLDDELENSSNELGLVDSDLMYLNSVIEMLNFGEYLRFGPNKLLDKFKKEAAELNRTAFSGKKTRFGYRKPKLAMVFPDLAVDQYQILMTTLATALQEIGYSIEVFSSEDGPSHAVWLHMQIPVTIFEHRNHSRAWNNIDWLSYDGVLLNSLEGKAILSSFMQEPFKSLPIIWTIHERTLATRLNQYALNGMLDIFNDWKKSFSRASVIVFPNYALPMMYSTIDTGNYFVIPGTPTEAWAAESSIAFKKEQPLAKMDLVDDDFVVAIVGSPFMYKGLPLEHALILEALNPMLADIPSGVSLISGLKIFVLTGDSTGNYTKAVEAISASLKYPEGIVKHADRYSNADYILWRANLVIYGSLLEEQSFPDILVQAMHYEKPIIAPDLSMIRKYVDDRVNGFLFPKEDIKSLSAIISEVVPRGKLSPLAHNVASIGKETAKNFMVAEAIEGFAFVLENILKLPSEVAVPKPSAEIPYKYKSEWRWNVSNINPGSRYKNRDLSSNIFLDNIQEDSSNQESSNFTSSKDDDLVYSIWKEQKQADIASEIKIREDQELRDRSDRPRGTWEDVYKSSKKADRLKNDLHEKNDGELERTGQPLCIYEPYFGEGSWPFLHQKSLYRGVSLTTRERKTVDDVDASSRLPLLSDSYYRDALGEFGAYFAIANRIDSIHKNAWVGFQSWKANPGKVALSRRAENALLEVIEKQKHGDAVYFWVRMDKDPRNPLKLDFWSFCDAVNAGNCRSAFSDALKRMYGIKHEWEALPPMPMDGDTWSVMNSWALPTRSFQEFVMFARMFVDALDSQMYNEHHSTGNCCLSLNKDKHCYSRVLELLINVWAYHTARHMIYVNPETGVTQEQHKLQRRRGQMWIRWFDFRTLKSMDEDLAEETDSEQKRRRWLWPSTGEIFWQGILEKERDQKKKEDAEKKRKSKEKLQRILHRNSHRHKPIGKFMKPPPEGTLNTTSNVVRR